MFDSWDVVYMSFECVLSLLLLLFLEKDSKDQMYQEHPSILENHHPGPGSKTVDFQVCKILLPYYHLYVVLYIICKIILRFS